MIVFHFSKKIIVAVCSLTLLVPQSMMTVHAQQNSQKEETPLSSTSEENTEDGLLENNENAQIEEDESDTDLTIPNKENPNAKEGEHEEGDVETQQEDTQDEPTDTDSTIPTTTTDEDTEDQSSANTETSVIDEEPSVDETPEDAQSIKAQETKTRLSTDSPVTDTQVPSTQDEEQGTENSDTPTQQEENTQEPETRLHTAQEEHPVLTVESITSDNENSNQYANVGDTISIEIEPNVQLSETPTVTIAGNSAVVEETPIIDRIGISLYTARYTVQDSDAEGAVSYTISAPVDIDGVVGDAITETSDVIIDKTPPSAPSTPDLLNADDTGTSNTDNITSKTNNIRFSVSGEKNGNVVEIWEINSGIEKKLGESKIGLASLENLGVGEVLISLDLETRNYTFFAREIDEAGNVSEKSPTLTVTIDESADLTETITPEGVAQSKTMTLEITGSPTGVAYKKIDKTETTAECSRDGYGNITASEITLELTSTSIEFDSEDDNGDSICFKLSKSWGVWYVRSSTITDIDLTQPTLTTPSISSLTNDNTPALSFTSDEAGDIILSGGCSSKTTRADIGENIIILDALDDGVYNSCELTITDSAQNTPTTLSIPEFTIDTLAPTYSAISLTSDNDPNTHARTGSVLTLTFSASEELGETPTVTIATNTATLRSPTTNADGTVTYEATYTVVSADTQGAAAYTISAPTDNAGNVGVQTSQTSTIIIDTIKPVITLTGDSTLRVIEGTAYTDEGATVEDPGNSDYSGVVSTAISGPNAENTFDNTVVGDWTLTYSASADTSGNIPDSITRTVTVVSSDAAPTLAKDVKITTTNRSDSFVKVGDEVTFTITTTKPVVGDLPININLEEYSATRITPDTSSSEELTFTTSITTGNAEDINTGDDVIGYSDETDGGSITESSFTVGGETYSISEFRYIKYIFFGKYLYTVILLTLKDDEGTVISAGSEAANALATYTLSFNKSGGDVYSIPLSSVLGNECPEDFSLGVDGSGDNQHFPCTIALPLIINHQDFYNAEVIDELSSIDESYFSQGEIINLSISGGGGDGPSETQYEYVYEITEETAEAKIQYRIGALTDGTNETPAQSPRVSRITVDKTPPSIVLSSVFAENSKRTIERDNLITLGDRIYFDIQFSEPLIESINDSGYLRIVLDAGDSQGKVKGSILTQKRILTQTILHPLRPETHQFKPQEIKIKVY